MPTGRGSSSLTNMLPTLLLHFTGKAALDLTDKHLHFLKAIGKESNCARTYQRVYYAIASSVIKKWSHSFIT